MIFDCFVWSQNPILKLRDVQFSIVAREISVLQNFVEHQYLKKIKLNSSGLRIFLVQIENEEIVEKPIKGVYPLVNLYMYFDFEHYLSLDDNYEKKKVIIAMFKEGVNRAAEFMGWDMNPLIDAFNQIDALNYEFKSSSTTKRFKGVKRYVQLETECEPGFYNYYLVIKEKEELISRHKVVTLNAFYNTFFEGNRIISEMKWEDANTFVILGKKGHLERIRFEYKLDTDILNTTFHLENDVNKDEFMEEFDLATTEDPEKLK